MDVDYDEFLASLDSDDTESIIYEAWCLLQTVIARDLKILTLTSEINALSSAVERCQAYLMDEKDRLFALYDKYIDLVRSRPQDQLEKFPGDAKEFDDWLGITPRATDYPYPRRNLRRSAQLPSLPSSPFPPSPPHYLERIKNALPSKEQD